MTKRIFSLITAIAVMTTMLMAFSIDAGAAQGRIFTENFEDSDYSDGTFAVDTSRTQMSVSYDSTEHAIKASSSASAQNFYTSIHDFDGTEDVVYEFDAKIATGSNFSMWMYFDGSAVVLASGYLSTGGGWKHFKIRATSNGTKITGYTGTKSNLYGTDPASMFTRVDASGATKCLRFCANNASSTIWLKNIKVYSGTVVNGYEFELNGTAIDELSDVTGAGDITVSAKIDSIPGKTDISKYFVVFDNNGKMLDIDSETISFAANSEDNLVTGTLTISSNDDATAVKNGGYIGLYFWNNMWPELQSIELK